MPSLGTIERNARDPKVRPGASVAEPPRSMDVDRAFALALQRLDARALSLEYEAQDCLLRVEDFVPADLLGALQREIEQVRPAVHRNYVPGQKKGGAVSRRNLDRLAPIFGDVYRSQALWRFVERLTGERLHPCRGADPHTYALYFYSEPGDHIGWHYDTSFYRGRRFTMLLCLTGNESTRLECELFTRDAIRPSEHCSFSLEPGNMVIFDGDRLWHRATPMAEGDRERVLLTMELVTDPRISWLQRIVSDVKDASAYFGFREVFGSAR